MQKSWFLLFLFFTFSFFVVAQEVPYGVCPGCWNADSLGNHRAVVKYAGNGRVVRVVIPWRREDEPAGKRIIVQDGRTGARVMNVKVGAIGRECGEIFFEPVSGVGDYYVYYIPYRNEGRSNYPKGVYWRPDTTASAGWVARGGGGGGGRGGGGVVKERRGRV